MMPQPCPLLLINLARSRERLASARSQLAAAGLEAERIEAVDGRALSEAELRRVAPPEANAFFKLLMPGEIGCYLSHMAAVERIVAEEWPVALVLEDDLSLAPHFRDTLTDLVARAGQLPDLVRLDSPFALAGGECIAQLPQSGTSLVRHRRPPACTVALLWTQAGARKFLAVARPLRRPVDVQLKHWWEGDLSILVVSPPAVTLDPEQIQASTIGYCGRLTPRQKVLRFLYRARYALRSQWELLTRYGMRSWIRANLG